MGKKRSDPRVEQLRDTAHMPWAAKTLQLLVGGEYGANGYTGISKVQISTEDNQPFQFASLSANVQMLLAFSRQRAVVVAVERIYRIKPGGEETITWRVNHWFERRDPRQPVVPVVPSGFSSVAGRAQFTILLDRPKLPNTVAGETLLETRDDTYHLLADGILAVTRSVRNSTPQRFRNPPSESQLAPTDLFPGCAELFYRLFNEPRYRQLVKENKKCPLTGR